MTSAPRTEEAGILRRSLAEALGTGMLLAAVVGSGIMAERLTTDVALQLLCNALATGAMLFVIIVLFAPVSGAHFNPAVTLVAAFQGTLSARGAATQVLAQLAGAILGVWLAHAMFSEFILAFGMNPRTGFGQILSECVATFGLVLTIAGTAQRGLETIAAAVSLYIVAAYWFTASTSFANPAVTVARSLTPSISGIAPADVPAFIASQLSGAVIGWVASRGLFARSAPAAPHPGS
jgi:glycerol uptake facilitator-like aquaporin